MSVSLACSFSINGNQWRIKEVDWGQILWDSRGISTGSSQAVCSINLKFSQLIHPFYLWKLATGLNLIKSYGGESRTTFLNLDKVFRLGVAALLARIRAAWLGLVVRFWAMTYGGPPGCWAWMAWRWSLCWWSWGSSSKSWNNLGCLSLLVGKVKILFFS